MGRCMMDVKYCDYCGHKIVSAEWYQLDITSVREHDTAYNTTRKNILDTKEAKHYDICYDCVTQLQCTLSSKIPFGTRK